MNPQFHICQNDGCNITITGLSYDYGVYLPEDSNIQPYDKYKYSDTITLNVIQLCKSETDITTVGAYVINHSSYLDEVHYKLPSDGAYLISHIILPFKEKMIEFIINEGDGETSYLKNFSIIYSIHNNKVMKLVSNKKEDKEFEEFVRDGWEEITFEDIAAFPQCNTNLLKSQQELFSVCNLRTCYVNTCKQLLKSNLNKCNQYKNQDTQTLIFNRDVLLMTLNVIEYYIDKDQRFEAHRILEEVMSCNGFCQETTLKQGGCNCGR